MLHVQQSNSNNNDSRCFRCGLGNDELELMVPLSDNFLFGALALGIYE